MPHAITTRTDGKQEFFSAGTTPVWHRVGQRVPAALTSAAALKMAALDWQVESRALMVTAEGPRHIAVATHKAIVRTDSQADGDAGHMIKVVQRKGCNLRTRFTRIIERAGLRPWPRLFHNLRASCATDFAESLPNHEAARYLGHSPLIAATHYLQPRDHNFRAITGDQPWMGGASEPAKAAVSGAQSGVMSDVQSGVQSGVRVA